MSDLLERFAAEYQAYHQLSDDRRRRQLLILRDLEAASGKPLAQVVQADFQAFAGRLLDKGYHVNTVRTKLNLIRPFFSWAYAVGAITADQYVGLKSVRNPRGSTGESQPNPYTKAELEHFWTILGEILPLLPARGIGSQAIKRWLVGTGRWRRVWRHAMRLQVEAIVALALDCGLRRGEIFRCSLDDLHYDNEYIVVTSARKDGTGQPSIRKVPFTEEAREACKAWLEFRVLLRPTHDRAWLTVYGSTTYANPMREARLDELLRSLLGPGWELQRFRHTCATNWLRAGMPLEKVSKLLGHARLQQTLAYAQIVEGDISRDMEHHGEAFARLSGRAAVREAA